MKKYADRLVKDDDFTITEATDDKIVLKRDKRFGLGKIKVTIVKEKGKYIINVGGDSK